MGVLAEFLKEKADEIRAAKPERDRLVSDWTAAVECLLGQIEQWLRESDPEGLIRCQRVGHSFNDEGMGPYTVPGLKLELDGQVVGVVPVARRVVASVVLPGESQPRRAEGRVDLTRYGDTHYILYRFRDAGGDRWYVVHDGVFDTKLNRPVGRDLTREEFEADLASLFR
jgi:hypothetical protein